MPGLVKQQPTQLERLCAKAGLRMTDQRRVIARVLANAHDHPDVEELHRRIHKKDSRISISTVYRTLRLLEENGILQRHDFKTGRGHYEPATGEHHDHLINAETGEVIEFHCEDIERLQEKIAQDHGLRLVGHRLELYAVPIRSKRTNR